MSEKEKPKHGTKMSILRLCLIFSLYPLFVLTMLGIALVYWAIGGYVKPSLEPEYIPTAEYLLENPFEQPRWGYPSTDGLWTEIYPFPPINDSICIDIASTYLDDFSNLKWVELYINEQVVRRVYFDRMDVYLPPPNIDGIHGYICYEGHLDTGLHIIEFRAKENLFAEPYYIHRWAIEIP
jgi:hypothetical protein